GGVGSAARFHSPVGLTVDRAGILYVADRDNNSIRLFANPSMVVATIAGVGPDTARGTFDGDGTVARFDTPVAVVVNPADGTAYVADTMNHTIRKVRADGVVTTYLGYPGTPGSSDGLGQTSRFNAPTGIAIDRTGNLYIDDTLNYTVRKVTP